MSLPCGLTSSEGQVQPTQYAEGRIRGYRGTLALLCATKAAVLLESITRSHPLVDGNKRLAWVAVVVCYGINDLALRAPQDPAYDLVTGVAEGRLPYPAVAARLADWVTPVR